MIPRALAAALAVLGAVGLLAAACSSSTAPGASSTPSRPPAQARGASSSGACPAPQLLPGASLDGVVLHWADDCVPYVRTPEARFASLPGYPFASHHALVDGLRMHYIDEGPRDGPVVLLLHGEPTWSYLYRAVVPRLTAAGLRVIAPDLIGMGASDKPIQLRDYSYLREVHWLKEFVTALDLRKTTVVAHDWGAIIGLRMVAEEPGRFAGVVVSNGQLPVVPAGSTIVAVPKPTPPDPSLRFPPRTGPDGWDPCGPACYREWVAWALNGATFRPSTTVAALAVAPVPADELAAYDAPFPSKVYETGVRAFPSLINTVGARPTNAAADAFFQRSALPVLTIFGRRDRNFGTAEVQAQITARWRGARGLPHVVYDDAGHFTMQDRPADFSARVAAFVRGLAVGQPLSTASS